MTDERDQQTRGNSGTQPSPTTLPLDRFNAFSDGVFAIAITLLVLELPVPNESVPLWPALRESWPEFLGYVISFTFIGGLWLAHSGLTKLMKRGDSVAYGINLLMLLFVCVMPFTTNVMVSHLNGSEVGDAVFLYGINVLVASLLLSFLMFYIAREPTLLIDDVADETLRRVYRERWIAIAAAIVAVAISLIFPYVAVGIYLAVTVTFLILPLLNLHRHWRRHSSN